MRLAKENFGLERYVKEFGSKGEVRQKFRLRRISAGLGDKEGCVICKDGKCELCVCLRMVNVSYVIKVL